MTLPDPLHAHSGLLARSDRVLQRMRHPSRQAVLDVISPLTRSLRELTPKTRRVPASDITDDGTPFELSLRFDAEEVGFRLLWEAQASGASAEPAALWAAAEEVTQTASELPGVDAAVLRRVQDLFEPRGRAPSRLAMWHALSFDKRGRFLMKVYLDPAARGEPLVTTVEALRRLGHEALAESVTRLVRGRRDDHVIYFSVDLEPATRARTKVYVAHPGVRLEELERACTTLPGYCPGLATDLVTKLGADVGAFHRRPIITCLAARAADPRAQVTVHFPVRSYVERDIDVLAGVARLVDPVHVTLLERILRDDLGLLAGDGRRAISYVSAQSTAYARGLTVYLQPHFLECVAPRPHGRANTFVAARDLGK